MMKKVASIILIVFINVQVSFATGIPTVDGMVAAPSIISALQDILSYFKQGEEVVNQIEQIENQVEQIKQMEQEFENMSGSYDLGSLFDSTGDRNDRRYLPNNYGDSLNFYSEGYSFSSNQKGAYTETQKAREGEIYTTDKIFDKEDSNAAKGYSSEGQRLYSVMGMSRDTYNRTEERMEIAESLSEEIDMATDMKAATDLGNRISVQQIHSTNELLRQISLLNIQLAEQREREYNRKGGDTYMSATQNKEE